MSTIGVGVDEVGKLLTTGWGQVAVVMGIVHLLHSNKTMVADFKDLIIKIVTIETSVIRQQVINEMREKTETSIKADIADLEQRMRDVEKNHGDSSIN